MMKNLMIGMVTVSMLAIGAPAAAQYYPNPSQNYSGQRQNQYGAYADTNMSVRIDQLRVRLQEGVQSGAISRREAVGIRDSIRRLSQMERQYAANGLTGPERASLQQEIRMVRQQLRVADNGAQGRYSQWDREDGYGTAYTQQRIDVNRDGWDDRDYDHDGRIDATAGYQQGYAQPYQQGYAQPVQQGGIAGVLGQILGTNGLRVGQRVSANLGAVPYQYQNQYRDGNGVYYRSDGRQIYQVDARTQTVVRIFSM